MSLKKEINIINDYPIYYVDIMPLLKKKGYSKTYLSKITGISYNALQKYCRSEIIRVDLDVVSRLCTALDCDISDIFKKK